MKEIEKSNIYGGLNDNMPEEIFSELLNGKSFKLEKIISKGHKTPDEHWYDQDCDEWVILLTGNATLLFEQNNQLVDLKSGDYLLIPAHCKHKVVYTAELEHCVWLAVHFEN